jgi:type IV pilus assembly protein PilN
VPNLNWDPRRLWITNFVEAERNVKVLGMARDGEDVSEFLRRLALSDYFYDVKLLPASKAVDAVTKLEMVKFEISAKVRY